MNILGVGIPELLIVLLIMLVVAGPKRMIQWAYVFGQYTAKLRAMWQETSTMLRKELADAGIEPEVVDTIGQFANPRSRNTALTSQVNKLVDDMKKPVEESLQPVSDTLKAVEQDVQQAATLAPAQTETQTPASDETTPAPTTDTQNTAGRYNAWKPN